MLTTFISILLSLFITTTSAAALNPNWDLITTLQNPEGYEKTKTRTGKIYPTVFDIYRQPTVVYQEGTVIYIAAVDDTTYNLAATALGDPLLDGTNPSTDGPVEPNGPTVIANPTIPDPYIDSNDPLLITRENAPEQGSMIEVSNDPDFNTFQTVQMLDVINGIQNGIIIPFIFSDGGSADGQAMYWIYGRTIADVVEPDVCSTTKAQLRGYLLQNENVMLNQNDTKKALNSFADMYGKVDEILNELCVLRRLVNESDLP